MIKRNSVTKRDGIDDLKVLETPDARIVFERKYTKANRYDRFSISNTNPIKEMYSVDVPKFVQVEYELLIWTNNSIQLNEAIEQLMWFDGKAFGDSHKFITHIDPPSFETVNSTGEDRIVRATMGMRTKAYILNSHGPNAPAMYKLNPVRSVLVATEIDTVSDTFSTGTGVTNVRPVSSGTGGGTRPSTNVNAALTYINSNKQLTGTVVNNTTVTFAAGWLTAPSGLPNTNSTNFIFYANGVLIESSAITSFTVSGNVSTLVINEANLGYSLDSGDEIIAIGKFS